MGNWEIGSEKMPWVKRASREHLENSFLPKFVVVYREYAFLLFLTVSSQYL